MLQIKYRDIVLSLLMILVMTGCSKFEEMNMNPSASTNMDPNLQLPTIQVLMANNHQQTHRFFIYPGGFMQQWAGDYATVEFGGKGKKYASYMEQLWNDYYPVLVKNVVDMLERTKDNPSQVNINAISRILKVYIFSILTDMYGDIPYFDAGTGYYTGNYNNKYDKQEEIYNDFFIQLDIASKALTVGGDVILYDNFYNGNIEKWRKFANSLRLRLAMRLVKVDPAKAQAEAEAAINMGTFSTFDDICYIKYENVKNPNEGPGTGNGYSNRLLADDKSSTFRLTSELIDYMVSTSDPRVPMYAGCYMDNPERTDITEAVLAQYGDSWSALAVGACRFSWDKWSPEITVNVGSTDYTVSSALQQLQPSKLITAFDAPYIHMSLAEVEFLKAEVAARNWNAQGTAGEHFANGLSAAVEQMQLFGATIDANQVSAFVLANPLVPGDEINQIATQLWVLHILNPFETWNNWRRTGYPNMTFPNYYPAENQSNGTFPHRYQYPVDEQVKNTDNYNEAVARMGTDDWMNRVWWDKL